MKKHRCLNCQPENEKDNRYGNHNLGDGFTPVGTDHPVHPRSRELALLETFEVIVAPTAMAKAISAAAITTVVALTSPRSISASLDAVNRIQ